MRVLLVKLSSLGDVIHNLPVASDLARVYPGIEIDWAVESPYGQIAALHPAVKNVLPVPLRRLKKQWWSLTAWQDFLTCRSKIAGRSYDRILDTQGLLKSAWVAGWAEGSVAGYSVSSVREPLAARFYDERIDVAPDLHAVVRNRQLAAQAFGYALSETVDYGISVPTLPLPLPWLPARPYVVFLHATSRTNKMWSDNSWIALGARLRDRGMDVVLPWGSSAELHTSQRLAQALPGTVVPPALSLVEAAAILGKSIAVVGVDTGLAHLAVALNRPTIGLYITTQPRSTGLYGGAHAVNVGGGTEDAPSIPDIDTVWDALRSQAGFA